MGEELSGCLGNNSLDCLMDPKTKEEKPVNGYYKKKELLNGLEVYFREYSKKDWTCPLCCIPLTKSVVDEFSNNQTPYISKIEELSKKFINVIETLNDEKDVDIFDELEAIDNEINKNKDELKKLEYYKYKCEANNKEIYLYIAEDCGDVRGGYRHYNRYISMNWKNNKNIKYELIGDRRYFLEREKYLYKWNELCEKKEAQNYQKPVKLCNQAASNSKYSNLYGNGINYLYEIFNQGVKLLKYNVNIIKLAEYVANFNRSEKNFFIGRIGERTMDDNEKKNMNNLKKIFLNKYKKLINY